MTYQEWLAFLQQYQQENQVYNSSYTGPQIDSAVGQVLDNTVIKNTAQTLTDAQKAQARANIGVTDNVFMAVYGTTTEEELTAAFNAGKQIFARGPNFPASIYTLSGYVMDYDPVSGMGYEFYFSRLENTTLQRIQCSRGQWSTLANIEMVDTSDLSQYRTSAQQDQIDAESVRVVSQTFTDAQKQQARSNIGAAQDEEVSDLKSAKAPVIIDTASGAIASFEDGADGMPLKSLTVNIEPVQEGSGDPAPDNVRPITGWTGCNIHVSPTTTGGTVYTVSFPAKAGTVYGGTLTINADGTGELVVDWVKVLAGETWSTGWTYESNVGTPYFEHAINVNIEKRVLSLCNKYKYGTPSNNSMADMSFGVVSNGKRIRFRNSNYTKVTDFVASLSGVEVVIPLAQGSPSISTHHLTIEQVTTLLGTNNVWADCGDVKVEYPADTKLYIQKINAPTDDDMTADTQIASGKYFLIGNTLYLSTTIIPAGDIIIPGTNCTKTNLAAALNALNA